MAQESIDKSVTEVAALRTLQQVATAEERETAADSLLVEIVTLLRVFDDRGKGDDAQELDDDEVAAIFRLTRETIRRVEAIERNTIRRFKHEQGNTWQDVADLHPWLTDKTASLNLWKRLTDDNRRVASGDFKRGAAISKKEPGDHSSPDTQ